MSNHDSVLPIIPDVLDVAKGAGHALHSPLGRIPSLGPLGAFMGFRELGEAIHHGDAGGAMQGGASGLAGVASTFEMLAGVFGWEAGASLAGSMALPLAGGAIGVGVGNSINERSGKDNVFGGHRNASKDAADTGDLVRTMMRNTHDDEVLARGAGGVTTLGMAGANTVDAALNAVVMPPALRGLTDGGGIAGTGISIMDAVPGGNMFRSVRQQGANEAEAKGPGMVDMYKWIARGGNPADSPFKGMY